MILCQQLHRAAALTSIPPSAVPPEQEAAYSAIIDSILQSSDLETVSAKRIRKGLQERVDYDISHQKVGSLMPPPPPHF